MCCLNTIKRPSQATGKSLKMERRGDEGTVYSLGSEHLNSFLGSG